MGYLFDAMNRAGQADAPPPLPADADGAAPSAPDAGRRNGPAAAPSAREDVLAAAERLSAGAVAQAAGELAESQLQLAAGFAGRASSAAASAVRADAPSTGEDESGHDVNETDVSAAEAVLPTTTFLDAAVETVFPDDRLVGLTDPTCAAAEEYRSIRTGILARCENRRHLVHLITSATSQEGKTITSLNLGLIFAEIRTRKTIVIEADLRLPQFGELLGLPPLGGLAAVVRKGVPLEAMVRAVGPHGLHVLPAGACTNEEAIHLLSSTAMRDLIAVLRKRYDHVIIDTPPVVELADAGILGAHSDDVLLVARLRRTPQPLIEQAVRVLASYNAPVAGLIATDQRQRRGGYSYNRYGYRYRRSYSQSK